MQLLEIDLGTRFVPYQEGWDLQRKIHAQVVAHAQPSTLIMLEHEPVYTVGKRTHSWERPSNATIAATQIPVVEVDRGGKTTWHGPGQLTVYPIIRLKSPIDVIKYVRALEGAVIELCANFGIKTMRVAGRSGVWVPPLPQRAERFFQIERKICALGVRVARGVTMHGIGFNVDPDLTAFSLDRIIPCGIKDAGVTSLTAETGHHFDTAYPAKMLATALEKSLSPLLAEDA